MANAKLLGTLHGIPDKVMESLKITFQELSNTSGVKGLKRLKGLIDRGYCTYEQLKRIKNYFDHIDPNNVDQTEYALNGGDLMRDWVNHKLNLLRQDIYRNKKVNADTAMVTSNDVSAPNVNPEKKNNRTLVDPPDLMTSNDLMEQVNKMRSLINII